MFDGFVTVLMSLILHLLHPLPPTFIHHNHIIQLAYLLVDLISNIIQYLFINQALIARKNKNLIPILKLKLCWPILKVQIYYLLEKYIGLNPPILF